MSVIGAAFLHLRRTVQVSCTICAGSLRYCQPISDDVAARDRYVSVIALLRRTAQLMVEELVERVADAGFPEISPTFHPVFESIDRDGTRLTDLAARASMTHQSMSELVASLERQGYVERRPDPSDGRARLVSLTPDGRRLVGRSIAELEAIEAKWQARWRGAVHRGDLRHVLEHALATESGAHGATDRSGPRRRVV
jgi:DNA-binding MarR family transcriptional regulator